MNWWCSRGAAALSEGARHSVRATFCDKVWELGAPRGDGGSKSTTATWNDTLNWLRRQVNSGKHSGGATTIDDVAREAPDGGGGGARRRRITQRKCNANGCRAKVGAVEQWEKRSEGVTRSSTVYSATIGGWGNRGDASLENTVEEKREVPQM